MAERLDLCIVSLWDEEEQMGLKIIILHKKWTIRHPLADLERKTQKSKI